MCICWEYAEEWAPKTLPHAGTLQAELCCLLCVGHAISHAKRIDPTADVKVREVCLHFTDFVLPFKVLLPMEEAYGD